MHCSCSVCNGKNCNAIGIQVADKEVIPYVKNEILKLKYPKHPFPMKYEGLLASLFAYSQALNYNRMHGVDNAIYYTENKWLLKYSSEIGSKFGMNILHTSELKEVPKFVCEFNTETK